MWVILYFDMKTKKLNFTIVHCRKKCFYLPCLTFNTSSRIITSVDSSLQWILARTLSSKSCQIQLNKSSAWTILTGCLKTCYNRFSLRHCADQIFKCAFQHGASVGISRGSFLSACLSFIYPRLGDKRVWSCWCIAVFSQTLGLYSRLSIRPRQRALCSRSSCLSLPAPTNPGGRMC